MFRGDCIKCRGGRFRGGHGVADYMRYSDVSNGCMGEKDMQISKGNVQIISFMSVVAGINVVTGRSSQV